jgi:DNA mismatch repair protein MLH3
MKFSHESIASGSVLPQVDRKFVPCVMMAEDKLKETSKALVIIDQHAADERVAVEQILDALSEGFAHNNMPVTELDDDTVRVVLTRQEVEALEMPGVREILRRWGIGLGDTAASQGDYTQVNALCVPQLLDVRLGNKNPTELTRLLRLYLPTLAEHLLEIQVLAKAHDRGARDGSHGWAGVQRWMPLEMVELANSKACRGAIMFEDRLDADQCERLVAQLGAAHNPWICAHGRPTLAPLTLIPQYRPPSRRPIDWAAWKRKHTEQARPSATH